nr:MAG TPA: hypothetical protein [Caudoviricetes sp.]
MVKTNLIKELKNFKHDIDRMANGFLHFASNSIGYIHWNEVPIYKSNRI